MKKIALIAGMGLMSLSAVQAQQDSTVNRTVVVENLYNPTVMDASKVNVLPKVEEPVVPKTIIDYSTSVRPMSAWNYQVMSPMDRAWDADAACRGYFRAGYGNKGNVDAQLGYLWDISKNDRLNVAASLDGWNGETTDLNGLDWKSRLYNTRIGLDYKHAFKKIDLMLGGYYRSQVFNYMSGRMYEDLVSDYSTEASNGRQHQTLGNVYVGLASIGEEMPVQFSGEIGMNYFKQKYPTLLDEGSETDFYVKGDVWKAFNGQNLGMAFDFNTYSYSMGDMEGNTSLELNPYYKYKNDDWRIRLGAHVDWWSGTDDKVNFSPDIHVEYIFSDSYVFYAKAGGGRENKSLMELTDITPYWTLRLPYLLPTYVSLDAAVGLKASPANGWWFNVTGGYQIREDDLIWMLGEDPLATYSCFVQGKGKVAYGSVEVKYDYKDLFDVALKGTYYNWTLEADGWGEELLLCLKPELEFNAEVGCRPMKGLRVSAGYEYAKRCGDIYDPISNLYVGADYAVMKNLGVFAKVNNLLNKEYVRADAYPAQKLSFLAGISLKF